MNNNYPIIMDKETLESFKNHIYQDHYYKKTMTYKRYKIPILRNTNASISYIELFKYLHCYLDYINITNYKIIIEVEPDIIYCNVQIFLSDEDILINSIDSIEINSLGSSNEDPDEDFLESSLDQLTIS